jgi:hypothetical protein
MQRHFVSIFSHQINQIRVDFVICCNKRTVTTSEQVRSPVAAPAAGGFAGFGAKPAAAGFGGFGGAHRALMLRNVNTTRMQCKITFIDYYAMHCNTALQLATARNNQHLRRRLLAIAVRAPPPPPVGSNCIYDVTCVV